ncbi:septum site-determining protein MinC [Advenella alkanexedens]|uniref:Probable septum site-determining protein MinC n=1 Tax=Advenella alkanexedens TaxID=1481665 RepID=A0ABS6NRJ7_9BURK|nr:septum site-determining protein MinC [Advenella sp.]MBV4397826.1 septum site-determining protein MinC [Advenella alkanexedens]MDD3757062.1 septum site-determining protein MinC [Advenella sp.]NLN66783.1 septum site-determining protein MinC [Alcaligenaceae bacterium]
MTSKANTTNALIFKSASLFALRIVLNSSDLAALKEAITRKMTEAGSLFKDEAVVLDATRINEAPDWSALLSHLQANHLPVIGVMAEGSILDSARQAGLVPVTLSTPSNAERVPHEPPAAPIPQPKPEKPEAKPVETPQLEPSLVIKRQLRSGQRIYARNSDLIVIGAVGRGAEIIADGNIHVYGPLRGKAIAGARGNTQARIFTTHLDAELLAIAGIYRLIDADFNQNLIKQAVIVELENESLTFIANNEHN